VPPCTSAQTNIIVAHMLALQHACDLNLDRFLVLESDAGIVHKSLDSLTFPIDWCVINVCPTNTAEPSIQIRPAHSPYDFGAVAIVYNSSCICKALPRLKSQFKTKCEPFDSVIYTLPGSFRTGIMWVEHIYKANSTHSDDWAHKLGPSLVAQARQFWSSQLRYTPFRLA